MKKSLTVLCLSALLTAPSALAHEDHGKAMHGGLVAEAGHAQFELVAQDGRLIVHVSNHGAPVSTAGATGKLVILSGASKREVELKPAGQHQLQGEGSLSSGDKLLLSVVWPGKKPLQARLVAP